jgi:hypothetical protein
MSENPFPEPSEDTPPAPTPVKSDRDVARMEDDAKSAPVERIFPEEHVAEIGEWEVVRSGAKCPQCSSRVFLHPDSLEPANTMMCFGCRWASLRYVWWEPAEISDY